MPIANLNKIYLEMPYLAYLAIAYYPDLSSPNEQIIIDGKI